MQQHIHLIRHRRGNGIFLCYAKSDTRFLVPSPYIQFFPCNIRRNQSLRPLDLQRRFLEIYGQSTRYTREFQRLIEVRPIPDKVHLFNLAKGGG